MTDLWPTVSAIACDPQSWVRDGFDDTLQTCADVPRLVYVNLPPVSLVLQLSLAASGARIEFYADLGRIVLIAARTPGGFGGKYGLLSLIALWIARNNALSGLMNTFGGTSFVCQTGGNVVTDLEGRCKRLGSTATSERSQ